MFPPSSRSPTSPGWGPASDTWTLGVTGCFLVSGQLIFNSHDPQDKPVGGTKREKGIFGIFCGVMFFSLENEEGK